MRKYTRSSLAIFIFFNTYSDKRTILSNLSILIIHFNNSNKIQYLVDVIY